MNVVHGRDHEGDLEISTEVVVVGSGAGGAVVAATLAEAGMDVVVLEEGGHVRPEEHARMRPSESLRHLWRDAGFTMAFGVGRSPMINIMMGRCIGGSSALTGGVCSRIPEAVLADWRALGLADFTPERLEPYYADVEANVHAEEVPASARSRSTQLFAEGARKLIAEIDAENHASLRLAEALGFTREGLLRAHETTHEGLRDVCLYGLLDSDPRPA